MHSSSPGFSKRACWGAACMVLVVAVAGCGDGRPTRVPVSGRVTVDGVPLKFGFVRFLPEGAARASTGRMNGDGRFEMTCFGDKDGVVLGKHRVEVIAIEEVDDSHIRWHAPKKYSSWGTSQLVQDISGPTDELHLELSWGGGKPFIE